MERLRNAPSDWPGGRPVASAAVSGLSTSPAALRASRKRYGKPLLTSADFLSPFTPPRQSAAPALLQPKLRASVPQSSSSWPRADV